MKVQMVIRTELSLRYKEFSDNMDLLVSADLEMEESENSESKDEPDGKGHVILETSGVDSEDTSDNEVLHH
mgnify:CR=1 FL=1